MYNIDVYIVKGVYMDRTQIYLTPEQKEALALLSKEQATTMAELIRTAVDEFLAKRSCEYQLQTLQDTCGAISEWSLSGEEYAEKMRSGWKTRNTFDRKEENLCDT